MSLFGERLKEARKAAGLTQEQLGEKIGVTGVTIMRYEKGERRPSYEQVKKMGEALGVNWLFLLGDSTTSATLAEAKKIWSDYTASIKVHKEVYKILDILFPGQKTYLIDVRGLSLDEG